MTSETPVPPSAIFPKMSSTHGSRADPAAVHLKSTSLLGDRQVHRAERMTRDRLCRASSLSSCWKMVRGCPIWMRCPGVISRETIVRFRVGMIGLSENPFQMGLFCTGVSRSALILGGSRTAPTAMPVGSGLMSDFETVSEPRPSLKRAKRIRNRIRTMADSHKQRARTRDITCPMLSVTVTGVMPGRGKTGAGMAR